MIVSPQLDSMIERRASIAALLKDLKQLGLDSRRLELPDRKRLDIDHGQPIPAIV